MFAPALAIAVVSAALLGSDEKPQPPVFTERVVAGGPNDFLEARHLVLRGSNRAIGQQLATIWKERFGGKAAPARDGLRTHAQRDYLRLHFPALLERMQGAADALGGNLDNDHQDFGAMPYLLSGLPGCSVVYYPPASTRDHVGVVSRNYDFTTGTLLGQRPKAGELGATARPFLLELHPDTGHASLSLCAYDLLGGTIDGINSEGLTVAVLADDELMASYPMQPTRGSDVGLDELQTLRLLLDTCATVEEAKLAALSNRHYYAFLSCHYLVADRAGNSCVIEYAASGNRVHFIDGSERPLVTTNFMLHLHDVMKLPNEPHRLGMFERYRTIQGRIAKAADQPYSLDFIKATNRCVACDADGNPPHRTLWHALYVPERRQLSIDFYLRDESDPNKSGSKRIVRSGYLDFELRNDR